MVVYFTFEGVRYQAIEPPPGRHGFGYYRLPDGRCVIVDTTATWDLPPFEAAVNCEPHGPAQRAD